MNHKISRIALLMLTMLLASTATAIAQRLNRLWIPECGGTASTVVEVYINLDNTDPVTAFQFDLTAPSGYVFGGEFTKSERLGESHTVAVRKLSDRQVRIIGYASDNAPIRGNAGSIGSMAVTVPANAVEGTDVELTLANVTLGTSAMENVLTETANGKLYIMQMPDLEVSDVATTVTSAKPGDTIPVKWKVSNIGKKAYNGGWSETIKAIGPDNRVVTLCTGYADYEGLAGSGSVERETEATIPELPGIDGDVALIVEVTPGADSGESQSTSANNSATSAATFSLSKYLRLKAERYTFKESDYRILFTLERSGSWAQTQKFTCTGMTDPRLPFPATIEISRGYSSSAFYVYPANNNILEGDSIVTITAEGNGYDPVEMSVTIQDDEKPDFGISVVLDNVTEGKNFPLKIDLGCAISTPTAVHLATDSPHLIALPPTVEIPAGTASVTIAVPTTDNPDINGNTIASIIATTESYGTSSDAVTIIDKDMPAISMVMSAEVLYPGEEGGFFATISRASNIDRAIQLVLDDDADGLLTYAGTVVEMPAGIAEITVPLYVADKEIKGGSKQCTITAAVLLKNCSCSAPAESAGSVSQAITIIDPKQKRLTLSCQEPFTSSNRTRRLTVRRNIDLSASLTVRLTSKAPIIMPPSVTIPAGQGSATFDATLDPAFTDGSGIVMATCEASGYYKGSCIVPYTAERLPDAAIQLALDTDKPVGGEKAVLNVTVANHGDAPLSRNTALSVTSRGITQPIATTLGSDIAPGQSLIRSFEVTFVDAAASFNIIGTVNASTEIKEATYSNNTASINCRTSAPFTCTVSADKDAYFPGEAIKISGKAEGAKAANATIDLFIISRSGNVDKKQLTADGTGAFSFKTTAAQCGYFQVIACYAGALPEKPQSTYNVIGMNVETRTITCDLKQNEAYSGEIEIFNPTSIELTGLKFAHSHDLEADGLDLKITDATAIAPGKYAKVPFSLTGSRLSDANAWGSIVLSATSDQQATGTVTLKYRVLPLLGRIEAEIDDIDIAVVDGEPREYTFRIVNSGAGETGPIAISLPKEVKSLTPATLVSLKPGEMADVSLRFDPGQQPSGVVATKGTIAFNCEHGIGLSLPFRLTYASTRTGKLKLKVTDEYAYYDNAGTRIETESVFDRAGVAGADVQIADAISGETQLTTTADARGYVEADLTSGHYTLKVSSPNHKRIETTIFIEPGIDNELEAFCSYEAIRYSWQVTETEVEDNYEMETVAEFTTMVPKPVVTIEYPKDGIPILQPFTITVTNHGLIRAYDINATLEVQGDFTPVILGDSYIDGIEAGETIELQAVLIPNELLEKLGLQKAPRTGRFYASEDDDDELYDTIKDALWDWLIEKITGIEGIMDFINNAKWWYYCFYLDTKLTFKYVACIPMDASEQKMYARLNSMCQEEKPIIAQVLEKFHEDEPARTVYNKSHKPAGGGGGGGGGGFIGGPVSGYEILPKIEITEGPCGRRKPQHQAMTVIKAMGHLGLPAANAPEDTDDATCATILLKFKQSIALTRQAFRGSFTIINGMPVKMAGIKVMLTITDEEGSPVTSHIIDSSTESTEGFEVGADGLWSVNAGADATATFLFIPTVKAAPDGPRDYNFGGYISFTDPETGTEKSLPLRGVTLTVEPTPELDLTYFMQRDVLGDDPLTDEVESIVPAEFSLLVNNVGNGEAKGMTVTTAQPEIIENEKGLKITYSIVSSQLNGMDHNLALGRSIETDFGSLPARSTAYAQWWMESTLLGHFVEYDLKFNHLSSHGNPDLSLVREVSIHELIRGLRFEDAEGKPTRAFIANDIADDESYPDMVYLSDGTKCPIEFMTDAIIQQLDDNRFELTVAIGAGGEPKWIYGNIADPTSGKRRITGIQRVSDGEEIDTYNFWLTDRTMYDYKKPVYEYRLHFADRTVASDMEKYVITFADRTAQEISVAHISAAVSDFSTTDKPMDEITVSFNSEFKPSSIRLNDNVALSLNGEPLTLTLEMVTIGTDFITIKPAAITDADGFYQLTIDCSRIQDASGYAGSAKAFFSWTKDKTNSDIGTSVDKSADGPAYDLLGRPVDPDTHHGIIVRKGSTAIVPRR